MAVVCSIEDRMCPELQRAESGCVVFVHVPLSLSSSLGKDALVQYIWG